MATPSSSPSPATSRRLPLRFSLRALLVVLTLACLGVAYWYRWPYPHEVIHGRGSSPFFWREGKKSVGVQREVQRYRRALRGNPIRHGTTEFYDDRGRLVGKEEWKDGLRHGRSTFWYTTGQVRQQGDFVLGKKDGQWQYFERPGELTRRCRFSNDVPEGQWEWIEAGKVVRTAAFAGGKLTKINDRQVAHFLRQAVEKGEIANPRITNAISQGTHFSFWGMPLSDVAAYIQDAYGIQFSVDNRTLIEAGIPRKLPITGELEGVVFGDALVLTLDPHDLAVTYRFGHLWITTKQAAQSRRDRTGIPDLLQSRPPDATAEDERRLEQFLDRPAALEIADMSLAEFCQHMSETYDWQFTFEGADRQMPLNVTYKGLSLRDALGAILDQQALRLRWKAARTLVIEPEEGATGAAVRQLQ